MPSYGDAKKKNVLKILFLNNILPTMRVWSNILGDIVENSSFVGNRLDLDTSYGV